MSIGINIRRKNTNRFYFFIFKFILRTN
ncbi:hypothetical protein CY0110_18822 [Crocosphaera chwakensis CCY0110]|uniref:Uncharacterized protein n=1 Tax=Crocosphaera chwakensis CCY0110 TaxID=391612 RepID=A3IJ96_9CHRO|nr:hypothetical protein CY0110_18822 [Crocosphaera chwakensis CCY0110]